MLKRLNATSVYRLEIKQKSYLKNVIFRKSQRTVRELMYTLLTLVNKILTIFIL